VNDAPMSSQFAGDPRAQYRLRMTKKVGNRIEEVDVQKPDAAAEEDMILAGLEGFQGGGTGFARFLAQAAKRSSNPSFGVTGGYIDENGVPHTGSDAVRQQSGSTGFADFMQRQALNPDGNNEEDRSAPAHGFGVSEGVDPTRGPERRREPANDGGMALMGATNRELYPHEPEELNRNPFGKGQSSDSCGATASMGKEEVIKKPLPEQVRGEGEGTDLVSRSGRRRRMAAVDRNGASITDGDRVKTPGGEVGTVDFIDYSTYRIYVTLDNGYEGDFSSGELEKTAGRRMADGPLPNWQSEPIDDTDVRERNRLPVVEDPSGRDVPGREEEKATQIPPQKFDDEGSWPTPGFSQDYPQEKVRSTEIMAHQATRVRLADGRVLVGRIASNDGYMVEFVGRMAGDRSDARYSFPAHEIREKGPFRVRQSERRAPETLDDAYAAFRRVGSRVPFGRKAVNNAMASKRTAKTIGAIPTTKAGVPINLYIEGFDDGEGFSYTEDESKAMDMAGYEGDFEMMHPEGVIMKVSSAGRGETVRTARVVAPDAPMLCDKCNQEIPVSGGLIGFSVTDGYYANADLCESCANAVAKEQEQKYEMFLNENDGDEEYAKRDYERWLEDDESGSPFTAERYRYRSASSDVIPGGLSAGRGDEEFDPQSLLDGKMVEREHTDDRDVAKEIAKDHLTEDPAYYEKLKMVESRTAGEGTPGFDVDDEVIEILRAVKNQNDGGIGSHTLSELSDMGLMNFSPGVESTLEPGRWFLTEKGEAMLKAASVRTADGFSASDDEGDPMDPIVPGQRRQCDKCGETYLPATPEGGPAERDDYLCDNCYTEKMKSRGLAMGSRIAGASTAFDVTLNGEVIDTVYYDQGSTEETVRRDLIEHDGYDPSISVTKRQASKKTAEVDVDTLQNELEPGFIEDIKRMREEGKSDDYIRSLFSPHAGPELTEEWMARASSKRVAAVSVGDRVRYASTAFDVTLNGEVIDTVYYDQGSTEETVRRDLIEHDGYDPSISVTKRQASKRVAAVAAPDRNAGEDKSIGDGQLYGDDSAMRDQLKIRDKRRKAMKERLTAMLRTAVQLDRAGKHAEAKAVDRRIEAMYETWKREGKAIEGLSSLMYRRSLSRMARDNKKSTLFFQNQAKASQDNPFL